MSIEWNEKNLEKGKLYLRLFHGRKDPTEDLDDWGSDGPFIGPLNHFHMTYFSTFKAEFEDENEATLWLEEHTVEDLILFEGIYYGDALVFVAE